MLDAPLRRIIDPPLNAAGRRIAATGLGADTISLAGLGVGLVAAALIALGAPQWALLPLLVSRVLDGLDGAVARAGETTDFGGYLDLMADFVFYGAIPFAFVLADPGANGIAGAFLLATFYVNGTSFMGYAVLAEKRKMASDTQGRKSLCYSNGILEGTETIGFFVLLCLFPSAFAHLAWIFGALCLLTAALRVRAASHAFPRSKDTTCD